MIPPSGRVARTAWRDGHPEAGSRCVPEETAIALTYNRLAYAVMMASPSDLEDFARGFSLTEAIVADPAEIEELQVIEAEQGIELRMWIAAERMASVTARRRRLAGPTGCGLCGLESLAEAMRAPPAVTAELSLDAGALAAAMREMARRQQLNQATRAVHAAGFFAPGRGLLAVREDVGRHNALDKLAGALAGTTIPGAVLMTSRVSVELVQKTAAIGAPVLAAVSAPTALAIRSAEAAGITLIGILRDDGFEVFTHPDRISGLARDAA
jgi:FdhD protein